MELLDRDSDASFSPAGILRFRVDEDSINSTRMVLESIRS
jgi:hypothetical protein